MLAASLHAGGERNRPQRIVRSDVGVVGLRHSGDQTHFRDSAGVAHIRLEHGGGLLFEHFRKPHLVNTRSPVAMGRNVPRAISAITSWFCAWHGSSMNIG